MTREQRLEQARRRAALAYWRQRGVEYERVTLHARNCTCLWCQRRTAWLWPAGGG